MKMRITYGFPVYATHYYDGVESPLVRTLLVGINEEHYVTVQGRLLLHWQAERLSTDPDLDEHEKARNSMQRWTSLGSALPAETRQ